MTDCKLAEDLMPLYAEDLTSPETNEWLEKHLENCPACKAMWNRCTEPLPQTVNMDESIIKQAMMKDAWRMIGDGVKWFVLLSLIPLLVLAGVITYMAWSYGEFAPMEYTASSYSEIFGGEMTVEVRDRDAAGPRRGGEGSIIRVRREYDFMHPSTDDWEMPIENVRIDIAPNGTFKLLTGTLPDGSTDYFIIAYRYEIGEMDGWIKTRLYPRQPDDVRYGNYHDGLRAVLIDYCRKDPELDQNWTEIEFTFRQWSDDSMAVEFFYVTDTGEMGTVTYSMEGQESTGLGSMSFAKEFVKG